MASQLEPIIAQCWAVGSSLLHPSANKLQESSEIDDPNQLDSAHRAHLAVDWLRMGLKIADRLENGSQGLGTDNPRHLKVRSELAKLLCLTDEHILPQQALMQGLGQ